MPFALPVVPRYMEVDQQGVVFNGHYLTWFDEAATALFDHLGVSFPDLAADGYDMQVVHADVDYLAPVRWRDTVRIPVQCSRIGTTSFTLGFEVWRRGSGDDTERLAVRGANVYVVVSNRDWTKRAIPEVLTSALRAATASTTSVAPQCVRTDGTVTP